jgi:hypothetical protein
MELIGWAWMTLCVGLVLFIIHAYLLCIIAIVLAAFLFYSYTRNTGLTENDIVDKVRSLQIDESTMIKVVKMLIP